MKNKDKLNTAKRKIIFKYLKAWFDDESLFDHEDTITFEKEEYAEEFIYMFSNKKHSFEFTRIKNIVQFK